MNNLVGISTQCLFLWGDNKEWLKKQIEHIQILKQYVSRVELYFSVDDILSIDELLIQQYRKELVGLKVSLHLPSLASDAHRITEIFSKINTLFNDLTIEYAVWHSDDFALTETHVGQVNPPFRFGLENSDKRKFGFQHLKDLSLLGNYPIILDIDHINEIEPGSLKTELIPDITDKILAIHFSTPTSSYKKFEGVETTHYPFSESGTLPPAQLPSTVPIVIEGLFPKDDYKLIEEEVTLVNRIYSK
jgi:hypothetical protein